MPCENRKDYESLRTAIPPKSRNFLSQTAPAYVSLRKIFNQITSLYNEAVTGYELALKSLFLQAVFLLLQMKAYGQRYLQNRGISFLKQLHRFFQPQIVDIFHAGHAHMLGKIYRYYFSVIFRQF